MIVIQQTHAASEGTQADDWLQFVTDRRVGEGKSAEDSGEDRRGLREHNPFLVMIDTFLSAAVQWSCKHLNISGNTTVPADQANVPGEETSASSEAR
jgi:hypothetical protein